jgi:hypothetical protein
MLLCCLVLKVGAAETSAAAEIIDGVGRLHLNYAIKKRGPVRERRLALDAGGLVFLVWTYLATA